MKYSALAMVLEAPTAVIVALITGGALAVLGVTKTVDIVGGVESFSKVTPVDHVEFQMLLASSPCMYRVCVPSPRGLNTLLSIGMPLSATVVPGVNALGLR